MTIWAVMNTYVMGVRREMIKQDRSVIYMNYELNMILEKIKCDFVCVYEGESKSFSSKEEFEQSDMEKNCTVSSISANDGTIVLELKKE